MTPDGSSQSPSDHEDNRPEDKDPARSSVSATLVCGADVDQLLEQVAEGSPDSGTPHQRECIHCQAAMREFDQLWSPVSTAATDPIPIPEDFTATVMGQVRRMARDVWHTLELTDGGAITIAARIVATIARDAARTVPGVRVALGRSTSVKMADLVEKATLGHRHPHAAVGVLGRTAVVDLALATTYGEPVHDVARRVQRRVIKELRDTVGLQAVKVHVTVDDVLDVE